MTNKTLVVLIFAFTCLICGPIHPLQLLAAAQDECISCEWFSPPAARALFLIDATLELLPSYNSQTVRTLLSKNGPGKNMHRLWALSAKEGEEKVLNEILNYLVDITEVECEHQGNWADVLVSLEARVMEGENPKRKNEMTPFGLAYQTRDLSIILEDQHLRLIDSCRARAMQLAQGISRTVLQTFIDYAKYLEKSLLEVSERNSIVLAELSANGDATSILGYLDRGRKLLAWDYLFEKIKTKAGGFFVQKGSELDCEQSLERNLVKKHEYYMAQLAKILDPFNKLLNYKPENYVMVPKEQKKGREIFKVVENHTNFLRKRNDVAELIELYSFWKTILERKNQLCG